jgi:hypothetical protein
MMEGGLRNRWSIHLAGVRQSSRVRAGGTVRRSIMNEFNNGFSAMPEDGFSAVSREELNQVEGGQAVTTLIGAIGSALGAVRDVIGGVLSGLSGGECVEVGGAHYCGYRPGWPL